MQSQCHIFEVVVEVKNCLHIKYFERQVTNPCAHIRWFNSRFSHLSLHLS